MLNDFSSRKHRLFVFLNTFDAPATLSALVAPACRLTLEATCGSKLKMWAVLFICLFAPKRSYPARRSQLLQATDVECAGSTVK